MKSLQKLNSSQTFFISQKKVYTKIEYKGYLTHVQDVYQKTPAHAVVSPRNGYLLFIVSLHN